MCFNYTCINWPHCGIVPHQWKVNWCVTVGWYFFPLTFLCNNLISLEYFKNCSNHFLLGGIFFGYAVCFHYEAISCRHVYHPLSPFRGTSLQFKVVNNLTKVTFLVFICFPHRKHWRKGSGFSTVLIPTYCKALMKSDYVLSQWNYITEGVVYK